MGRDEGDGFDHSDSHSVTDIPKTVHTDQEMMCSLVRSMQVTLLIICITVLTRPDTLSSLVDTLSWW